MTDASENIAYRYCCACGAIIAPDTNGPCECSSGNPAVIGLMRRRRVVMREISEYQLHALRVSAAIGTIGMLLLGACMLLLARTRP